jgi:hypothetical protein
MDDIRAKGIISRWGNINKFLNLYKEQYIIEWTTWKQKAQTSAWVQGHGTKTTLSSKSLSDSIQKKHLRIFRGRPRTSQTPIYVGARFQPLLTAPTCCVGPRSLFMTFLEWPTFKRYISLERFRNLLHHLLYRWNKTRQQTWILRVWNVCKSETTFAYGQIDQEHYSKHSGSNKHLIPFGNY